MAFIYINSKKFENNVRYFKKIVGIEKICFVLKDNAYGHGLIEVAKLALQNGIVHCCVKNEDEAQLILDLGFESILILYPNSYHLSSKKVIYALNSNTKIDCIPKGSRLEIKLDTGMGRNGLRYDDKNIIKIIKHLEKSYEINGFFSHFSSADQPSSKYFLSIQLERYKKLKLLLTDAGFTLARFHSASTAGTIELGDTGDDIYRIGLGLYGYSHLDASISGLKPILSLYGQKISTRVMQKGERIGYGELGFVCTREMCVSNYDVGYGQFIPRITSKDDYSTCNGKKILGTISMDSLSLESRSDFELIFENAQPLAELKNTIVYEILSKLCKSIPRTVGKGI